MSDLRAFNVESRRAVLSLRGVGDKLATIRRTLGDAAPAELDEAIAAVGAAAETLNGTESRPAVERTAEAVTAPRKTASTDGEKKTPKKRATRKTSTKEK